MKSKNWSLPSEKPLEDSGETIPKVLYFSSASHVQGGAVQSMFRLARWLKRRGGVPVAVLPREGAILDWYAKDGIDVRVIPFTEMRRPRSPLYLIRYLASTIRIIIKLTILIRQENVDIVHVNEITYLPGLIAARIAGVGTVCHVRVILERRPWIRRALSWTAQRFSDQILCVSEAVRTGMFPRKASNVRTLHNPGPDLDRFDPLAVESKDQIRRELGIDSAIFLVGQISKFAEHKNQMALVKAAQYIRDRHRDCRIGYLLVGGKVAGHEEYFQRIVASISESGLSSEFFLAAVRSDVPRMIAACDVVVHLPVHEDPLPNVVFEAMAMEKPVVAFASGGISEQFENGTSGILLEKNDIEGLAATLVALEGDKALRLKMGKEARRFLTSRFSFEKFSSELGGVYADLVSRMAPSGL